MSNTPNLVLPFLAVGQAQKHVTVNESLRRLDAIVQLSVVSASISAQPASPADGAVYIVPEGKSGADWGAFANWSLGYYRDGAWEQVTPREGWLAFVADTDQLLHYTGAAWSLLSAGGALTVSASDRVLGRATSGAGAAEEIAFTDQAQALCDDASFEAMCATLGTWRVVGASAVAASHTGNTSETPLATVTLPGGAMGANGILRITCLWSMSATTNTKTLRVRFGGAGGSGIVSMGVGSSNASAWVHRVVQNRGAENSQVMPPTNLGTGYSVSSNTPGAMTRDTAVAQDIVFSGQLSNAGETVTLESWLVEVAHLN